MDIYERYGRLMVDYQTECENHRQTINVLRRLKQGDIALEDIVVTDDNRWSIIPMEVVSDVPILEASN